VRGRSLQRRKTFWQKTVQGFSLPNSEAKPFGYKKSIFQEIRRVGFEKAIMVEGEETGRKKT